MIRRYLGQGLDALRRVDSWVSRRNGRRRILVDARTPVNFNIVAPVCRALQTDPRVEIFFTASDEPHRMAEIYRAAGDVSLVAPARAALMKFDAYVASRLHVGHTPEGHLPDPDLPRRGRQ